ncbi:hypothetical protein GUITHDRAFT_58967, partial [Guillardia theta CCMP2712]
IAPIIGIIFNNILLLAHIPTILACRRKGTLGEVNPMPFPLIVANSLSWCFYSVCSRDPLVFCGNFGGCISGLWYYSSALQLADAPTRLRVETTLIVLVSVVGLTGFAASMVQDVVAAKSLIGYISLGTVFFLFSSPLSTVVEIVNKKNADSINRPFACAQLMNCLSWLVYGLMVNDLFIALPNIFGIVMAITQGLLI